MMVRIIEIKMTIINNNLFILSCPVSDFPTFQLCYHFTTSRIPALQSTSLSLSSRLDLSNSLFLTIHPSLFLSLSLIPLFLCLCHSLPLYYVTAPFYLFKYLCSSPPSLSVSSSTFLLTSPTFPLH